MDKELLTKTRYTKSDADFGKAANIALFAGSRCLIRRGDGVLVGAATSPYPAMVYDMVRGVVVALVVVCAGQFKGIGALVVAMHGTANHHATHALLLQLCSCSPLVRPCVPVSAMPVLPILGHAWPCLLAYLRYASSCGTRQCVYAASSRTPPCGPR